VTENRESAGRDRRLEAIAVSAVLLTVMAGGVILWALRSILTPLFLALFLLLVIQGFARALRRVLPRLPERIAITAALVCITAGFAVSVWLAADATSSLLGQAGDYRDRLNQLLGRAADAIGLSSSPTLQSLWAQVDLSRYAGTIGRSLQHVGSSLVFVLVYLGFLIASRACFAHKVAGLFGDGRRRDGARRLFGRISRGVESYVWVQTLTGLMIAGASAVIMAACGLSHVLFWTFVIFVSSYIPILGGAVGVLIPPLFSLLESDGLLRPLLMFAGLQLVQFVVANVVLPRMQSSSLNLDPVVVLLSLAFWAALWGATGAFLSTPLTLLVMVALAEIPSTRWLAVLLSADGQPDKVG
jgi:predicted PurR-regulated permease PerM